MSDSEVKNWSKYDIDSLLRRTDKSSKNGDGAVVENFARTMRLADSVTVTAQNAEESARIEEIITDAQNEAPEVEVTKRAVKDEQTGDVVISTKTAKQRVADVMKGIKTAPKPQKDNSPEQISIFDEPLIPKKEHSMETDENRRRFLEVMTLEDEEDDTHEATKVIERSGFVMKRGKVNLFEGYEEAPKIVDADDARNSSGIFEEKKDEAESWTDGQIKLSGFENHEETPVKISEEEAEANVRKNRREKISKFRLMGIAEAEGGDAETDKNIEKLFTSQQPLKKNDSRTGTNNAGVEYTDAKDANRIRGTIHKLKKFSLMRLAGYGAITVFLIALNIISCVTAGYDTKLFQIAGLGLLILTLFIGINNINSGIIALFKKEADLKSAITVASLAALVQNICALAGSALLDHHSFLISGCVSAMFALNEYGEYLRHARTYDAFNFCTGKMKKKLYSIQEIENKNEKFEIGRNLLMDSPDIRYSCRAKFPSKLIGQCESDVSSDKLQAFLLPAAIIGSVICGVVGGIISKDVIYGVTVWAGTMCVCVPAFGVASIQLPLKWANKRLNKAGGLITGQHAIEDYSKTNAIVLDSADLFDTSNCRMHGFKDFKHVRIDDIMLYAAAMVVRSGGPLADVFDQVVSSRELLPEVRSFSYEDRMGISGWINGQKVIMGNRNMMRHHNFELDNEEDEEKYTRGGRQVIYLAIANSMAAMLVVSYAPNKKLIPFIKRLGTDGVTILLRNNDSNITTDMINDTFGVKFNNIRLMSNTAGRLYKKYRSRVREHAKSGIIHDGTAFSFMRTFTMSYTLCGTFKVENLVQLINVLAAVVVTGVLGALKVFSAVGMWPLLVFQLIMTAVSFFIARMRGIF